MSDTDGALVPGERPWPAPDGSSARRRRGTPAHKVSAAVSLRARGRAHGGPSPVDRGVILCPRGDSDPQALHPCGRQGFMWMTIAESCGPVAAFVRERASPIAPDGMDAPSISARVCLLCPVHMNPFRSGAGLGRPDAGPARHRVSNTRTPIRVTLASQGAGCSATRASMSSQYRSHSRSWENRSRLPPLVRKQARTSWSSRAWRSRGRLRMRLSRVRTTGRPGR